MLNNRYSPGNNCVSDKIFVDNSKEVVFVSELTQRKLLLQKKIYKLSINKKFRLLTELKYKKVVLKR